MCVAMRRLLVAAVLLLQVLPTGVAPSAPASHRHVRWCMASGAQADIAPRNDAWLSLEVLRMRGGSSALKTEDAPTLGGKYFPRYHPRPSTGHINDMNGPMFFNVSCRPPLLASQSDSVCRARELSPNEELC